MSATVHVTNISSQTDEKAVRDFFSFCGKISSLELTDAADSTKSAKVTFEKSTAAKTAELLNDTQLGTNSVKVTADTSSSTSTTGNTVHDSHDDEISQEDKPRTRIIAEYLAHGYTISDNVINKAIAVDNTHGYTDRFTTLVKNADAKTGATATLQNVDAKLGVTEKGREAWSRINSFFSSALETNAGHKILDFYSQGKKEVLDVHTEARRLADMKNPNNNQSSGNADPSLAQDKNLHNVPGTDGKRTACSCSGNENGCPCEPGKCACGSCGKNPDSSKSSEKTEHTKATA